MQLTQIEYSSSGDPVRGGGGGEDPTFLAADGLGQPIEPRAEH